MKIAILHPPLYPINNDFFEELGKYCDLTIYNYGSHPRLHKTFRSDLYKPKNYTLKIYNSDNLNSKRGTIPYRLQLNVSIIYDAIKTKPDLIISVAFWFPSLILSFIKRISKFKMGIITDAVQPASSRLLNLCRINILRESNIVFSGSNTTSKYIRSIYSSTKIVLSEQVINYNKWVSIHDRLPSKKSLRHKLKLPTSKKIILGVGNITTNKNWQSVLPILLNNNNLIFVLVGSGEGENELKKEVKKKGLFNQVFLVGRKESENLQKYYKSSDFFILPSLHESFGFVVVEALASGLPVICNKNAGAATLINNSNGILIDSTKIHQHQISDFLEQFTKVDTDSIRSSVKNFTIESKAKHFYSELKKI